MLAGLKAAGLLDRPGPSPREIASEFLGRAGAGSAEVPGGPALFTDVAPGMGIRFVHDNAARGEFRLPEEMGPGAALFDLDGDGDLDVFVAGGGALSDGEPVQTCRLYRNDGDLFTDVTEQTSAGAPGPAYGVACADYDDDGDTDIFVTRLGLAALLRNDGTAEEPLFVDVAREAGVDAAGFGASACFLDFDRDGRLDLFVSRYVDWSAARETPCYSILGVRDYCNPLTYESPSSSLLYRNKGGGRFEDVSAKAGIAAERGHGLGVLASDFDGDGLPDIFIANDQTPGILWRNNGNGTFENAATRAGCAYDARGVAIAGMGVAAEDLDGDLDLDLFVTNIHDQVHLVLTNEAGSFEDVSLRMGLARWSLPATGFGVALFDQDNDGSLDGFIANGDVNIDNDLRAGDNPYAQPDHFVRLRGGIFVDESAGSGAAFADVGRGAAAGDFDGDGDVDLLVANNGGPLRLLRNDNGTGNAWVGLDLRTGPGRRAAIGAKVSLTACGRTMVREIRPQQSYLSSGDPRAHFGLGRCPVIDRVEILWPDGARTVHENVAINRYVRIEQPEGSE